MIWYARIDESNWRNDYPDEDEWRSGASSEYEMSSDNECYRYQPIGRLGLWLCIIDFTQNI